MDVFEQAWDAIGDNLTFRINMPIQVGVWRRWNKCWSRGQWSSWSFTVWNLQNISGHRPKLSCMIPGSFALSPVWTLVAARIYMVEYIYNEYNTHIHIHMIDCNSNCPFVLDVKCFIYHSTLFTYMCYHLLFQYAHVVLAIYVFLIIKP